MKGLPAFIIFPTAVLTESFMALLRPTVRSQSTLNVPISPLLADKIPLIIAFTTDKLLTHKSVMQFVTVKFSTVSLATDKLVIAVSAAERTVVVIVFATTSFTDKLLTHKLSIQLKTDRSVTVKAPSIVTLLSKKTSFLKNTLSQKSTSDLNAASPHIITSRLSVNGQPQLIDLSTSTCCSRLSNLLCCFFISFNKNTGNV